MDEQPSLENNDDGSNYELSVAPVATVLTLICLFVIFLINHYGDRRTVSYPVLLVILIGWLFPFFSVTLLPLDLSSTKFENCIPTEIGDSCDIPYAYAPASFLRNFWRVIYWTSFVLCWVVIPLLQNGISSGAFTFKESLRIAIRRQLIYFAGVGTLGIGFLIYLISTKTFSSGTEILAFCMALSNAYGLVLIILFMGYGLVDIPRTLWRMADVPRCLKLLEFRAPKVKENVIDAEAALYDTAAEIQAVSNKIRNTDPLRPIVDKLLEKCPLTSQAQRSPKQYDHTAITMNTLADLNAKISNAAIVKNRNEYLWNDLSQTAFLYDDILSNSKLADRGLKDFRNKNGSRWKNLLSLLKWVWYLYLRPPILRLLAIMCGALSLCFIWSEVTFNIKNTRLSVIDIVINGQHISYGGIEIGSTIAIIYMCICAYSSLMKLKIFDFYHLVPNHNSDANTMLFTAAYMSRLAYPLCYNFLNLVSSGHTPPEAIPIVNASDPTHIIYENVTLVTTSFEKFMGGVDLIPLGEEFNTFAPTIIVLVCLFTLLNVYDRILKFFGLGEYYYSNWTSCEEDIAEGRQLLAREREEMDRGSAGRYSNATGSQRRASLIQLQATSSNIPAHETESLFADDRMEDHRISFAYEDRKKTTRTFGNQGNRV